MSNSKKIILTPRNHGKTSYDELVKAYKNNKIIQLAIKYQIKHIFYEKRQRAKMLHVVIEGVEL